MPTDETLRCVESRIAIFEQPVMCTFCDHDVWIPYSAYRNVEQPGIGVRHSIYVGICQRCGQVKLFGDPSYYDAERDNFIWALSQYRMSDSE